MHSDRARFTLATEADHSEPVKCVRAAIVDQFEPGRGAVARLRLLDAKGDRTGLMQRMRELRNRGLKAVQFAG